MDFTRPLLREESVVSQSKVVYVPVEDGGSREAEALVPQDNDDDDDEVDRQLVRAANRAAADLFGVADERDVDSSRFPDRLLPQHPLIQAGDLVVLQLAFDQLDFVYVTPEQVYHSRNGRFRHDDFVGMPHGSKVRSSDRRGYGYVYLLRPTPELWARSLNHRTQIIHELDSSQIVFQLHLRPNMTVVETGTGSTALSHAIARTIAPHGTLHTIEFSGARADAARAEFERNGLASSLVRVYHLDACADGFVGICDRSVDAVALDLPEPWRAVPHAARTLKVDARIASYSPCVEQTQRTVAALKEWGFHTIVTMEYRLQEHYVDQVTYDPPPAAKRPKLLRDRKDLKNDDDKDEEDENDGGEQMDGEAAAECESSNVASAAIEGAPATASSSSAEPPKPKNDGGGDDSNPSAPDQSRRRRQMVVARPFPSMRGHTAFLTFATLGLLPKKPSNGKESTTSAGGL